MPATGDVIELVHEQSYLGQSVNNVYYFQNNDVAGTLISLADWFETNVVPAIKIIQNDLLTHTNLRLRNLFLDAETHEEPLAGAGGVPNGLVEMNAFFASTIRFDHVQGGLRPGFKRFAGHTEAQIEDSLWIADTITKLNTIGDHLIQPPTVANPGWVPVVVQRVCETPNPDPEATPSCLKYRLPESQAELITGVITSHEVYSQPTTQNSRKWYT